MVVESEPSLGCTHNMVLKCLYCLCVMMLNETLSFQRISICADKLLADLLLLFLVEGCDRTLCVFLVTLTSMHKVLDLQHDATVLCVVSSSEGSKIITSAQDRIIRVSLIPLFPNGCLECKLIILYSSRCGV